MAEDRRTKTALRAGGALIALLAALGAGLGWVATTGSLPGILGARATATAVLLVLGQRVTRAGAPRAAWWAAGAAVLTSAAAEYGIAPTAHTWSWTALDVAMLLPAAWLAVGRGPTAVG